jgi:ribose transport system substrate-binding protein
MQRIRTFGIALLVALVAAACGGGNDDDTSGGTGGGSASAGTGPLAEFGESIDADPTLVDKALGPVTPSDEASWNIILASIARADQDLDQATIDKAMECFNNQECDTGTGGEIIMGYADGGGDTVNVWRAVSHMEAILQALTYDEIGTIVSTEANFGGPTFDPTIAENDIRFLINRGVNFIVGYPDIGVGLAEEVTAAEEAGIPYIPFSAGYVGLPGTEGALTPGEDYLTVVGEDLCALGDSFAQVLNDGVGTGEVAILGGTPNNALSLGWQQCTIPALADGVDLVNPPPNENTTTGDTFWSDSAIPSVFQGLLTTNPEIKGYAYEYADGMNTGLQEYDALDIPVENLTLALRTDEQTLFCDWIDRAEPTYKIFYSAGGNFQSRVGVTAAMMNIAGAPIPAQIVVPHVMREVTEADCNPDRVNPYVSGTSLVPDPVLELMFAA